MQNKEDCFSGGDRFFDFMTFMRASSLFTIHNNVNYEKHISKVLIKSSPFAFKRNDQDTEKFPSLSVLRTCSYNYPPKPVLHETYIKLKPVSICKC
jgi:hypothetical protein